MEDESGITWIFSIRWMLIPLPLVEMRFLKTVMVRSFVVPVFRVRKTIWDVDWDVGEFGGVVEGEVCSC